MDSTERFSEVVDVMAAIAPITANGTVAAHNSGYVDLADYHRTFTWLHVGTPAGASTIDVALWEATSAAGAGAALIAGKAITQVVAADAGVYVGIELRPEELSSGFSFVQAVVTVGTAAYTYSLVVFGLTSRYEPVGVTDFAEIVT